MQQNDRLCAVKQSENFGALHWCEEALLWGCVKGVQGLGKQRKQNQGEKPAVSSTEIFTQQPGLENVKEHHHILKPFKNYY